MTNVLDDAQVSVLEGSLENFQVLDAPPELGQALLLPGEAAPLVLLPLLPLAAADPRLLVFAPAPAISTVMADRTVIAAAYSPAGDLPAPLVRPRRRFQMDWYEAAVITLILGCAALGAYRLMWAIQP